MIKKFWGFVTKSAEVFCVLGFAALFTIFIVQVFFRYVLNDPLSWTQEVAGMLYVWIVCVGSATIVKEREHVSFDLLYESVSPHKRRILALLGTGLILIILLVSAYGNYDYIAFTARQKSPTLRLPMTMVFGAFGVFLVLLIVNSAVRIHRLVRGDWEREL
ncbi:TRAP transporter small permease [Hoeflea sp. G2-23]|uniref:TRAP transporter small permease protein n=1 Tax=Hoeflea algicola TaxID=2983763 RepID=A0ABT3ZFQ8_9HYPH|nr:TRAP transporter small permease [Hoeflea algicola]MCY0150066.1 TRAP transporter small permease [Hoeflea algicola]